MEAVLGLRRNVDDRAGADRAVLTSDADGPSPGHDVVDLVLLVRPLAVLAAGRPDGEAHAEQVGGQKIDVAVPIGVTLRVELRDLEGLHRPHLSSAKSQKRKSAARGA